MSETVGHRRTDKESVLEGEGGREQQLVRRREDQVDREKVSAALRELAAEYAGTSRSETARLREVLDDVEAALAAGASHTTVLETLNAVGFTLTPSSFESTLAQLRKERRE